MSLSRYSLYEWFATDRLHCRYLRAAYDCSARQVAGPRGQTWFAHVNQALLCGVGRTATAKFFYEQLHARNLQASATLFDMRPEVLARSLAAIRRNQPEPSVQTSVGNALALPFPDATFDWIETDHFLQFFPPAQLPALIAQWQRVLKPGGVLTTRFFSPDLANRRERLQNANWKFISRLLSAPSHFHPTDEIVKFFEAEKFAVATERLYPRPAPPVIALTAFKPNAG
jgi:ubiquinone/menaquinone biosynthesis C-methylase UbiE